MILTYVLFALGFVILIKGADYLIDGSASIAKRFNVSDIAIGLTIIAFGTSAPELVVNIFASFAGSNEIAIGNVFGSNISNVLLILGVTAIIYPITVKQGTVYKEIPFNLLGVLMLGIVLNDAIFNGLSYSVLSRADGLVLIGFFIIFLYYTFGIDRISDEEAEKIKKLSIPISILMIAGGILGLTFGGKWIVDGATDMAMRLGISEAFVGLTIVAVGTSLPELATSVMAARKKKVDIAIGNVVGSNIFNVLWILGLSSTIRPIEFASTLNADLLVVIASTILLFIFTHTTKPHRIDKRSGMMFVLLYAAYIVYLVWRG
jgi:cation:H+ antiporter